MDLLAVLPLQFGMKYKPDYGPARGAAVIKVFEGQPDHLIPSIADSLLDDDLFAIAGRMIGHSFLHHGPSFPGLSPAIIHTLLGGSLETTPITVQDCPDLDIRDIVAMLSGNAEIDNNDKIKQLSVLWNLPTPSPANRKWLSEKLLLHVVIKRTRRQVSQFRRGLQDTGLWPILIHRKEIIPILFPREAETQVSPQMLLDCIRWPLSTTAIFECYKVVDFDERDAEDASRVSGYLRTFIENASSAELKTLIWFWIGWEVPAAEMTVEIVEGVLPTAVTCFEKLRLPRHYTEYNTFQVDLRACIATSWSGFGCA
ncbi:G2/M phase-specific E3 ubiquitin-protein ligase-like [Syngnathoides biaculeatus]|uniref:G2/M phase-specific E3 ubiquitin-protein ligase-like n=1 Tax=Syngnathoides biaculeatus TaxID=300417 RepID=UPI002ADE154F|nr:G2/M phase-specific E3 ubiquitin-protein ligase-like [Syngnathoides biaculeatus]